MDEQDHPTQRRVSPRDLARERFGGTNMGAAFFGWLVAMGVLIILIGIVGAVATAVGAGNDLTFSEAVSDASSGDLASVDAYGAVAAGAALLILMIGYFAGGYVAGRMSRFDGGRQGSAVWMIGVLITVAAATLGALAGREYDVLDRVALPSVSYSSEQLSIAGLVVALVVLVLTLLAAMAGGRVGHRYHDKVDRVAGMY